MNTYIYIPCLELCHHVQYGYTLASFKHGVKYDLHPELECQPPWDKDLSDFYLLHFTYGNDFTLEGKFTPGKIGEWRFDKRSYTNRFPPKNMDLPPKGTPETVVTLIEKINEASANSPYWQGNGDKSVCTDVLRETTRQCICITLSTEFSLSRLVCRDEEITQASFRGRRTSSAWTTLFLGLYWMRTTIIILKYIYYQLGPICTTRRMKEGKKEEFTLR